ncbi:uncharacterized protein FOMMEDRAFT_97522 [Fomitiporia mediterranea MF3/22]|uniref:uncharacterized protein n=1 Tax=Fomitiporia mediterranea (strain MF3/22) TaxID=694068 RepID=UPI00044096EC|nr:uncharacterized protein FOMMEDRAFT_97522 [Fomitiporia mediterranea MF3/22]EJC97912.1 hypothetical protein FOMMEDRAFT_97522 [Fomitiporia mediterranea MF3/22]
MAKPNLVFYDMKTNTPGVSISPNTWRVRLVLNFKQLPYETVWCERAEIAPTCIAAGVPPLENYPDGSPHYTFPGFVDRTNPDAPVCLSESRKIIDYLEVTYPSLDPQRALFPPETHAFQAIADEYVERIFTPMSKPLAIYGAAQRQTEKDRAAFEKKHSPPGKTLEEANLRGKERDEAWARLREEFDKLASFAEGDAFFSGENLRYLDIHVLARLIVLKLSVGEEEFNKELGSASGGRWSRLWKACQELIH